MYRRFQDRVALVTGGASGIGAATARRLATEGARVVVADIAGDKAQLLAKELGGSAIGVSFDAGNTQSVRQLVDDVMDHFGHIDVLHNNAAVLSAEFLRRDTDPVNIDFATWDKTFAVNLRGYLAGCKYVLPHMLERGSGAIVMTASGSGAVGDTSLVAYGCSKAGVIALVKYVATCYGKNGIRCNAVNPGFIMTQGLRGVTHVAVDSVARSALTSRLATVQDIAAAVAFLASDDAAMVTGTILDVNGGFFAHMPYYADLQVSEAGTFLQ